MIFGTAQAGKGACEITAVDYNYDDDEMQVRVAGTRRPSYPIENISMDWCGETMITL